LEQEHLDDYEALGIDLLISPERRTALTLYQSIEYPHFLKVDTLGEGNVHINQYLISPHSPFAYKKIKDIALTTDMLIVGITRKRDFLFPTGETTIFPNDTLFIVAKQEAMQDIQSLLPIESKAIKRIILLGASKISFFLARLIEKKFRVIVIEPDHEKSDQLAQLLDNTVIYHEDIFTSNLLNELMINEHDYFIAATENDEVNLLSSILVKDMGLSMIACIIHRSYLLSTIEKVGIYQVFSPQIITSNDIAGTIRSRDLITLQNFQNIAAEFVELIVQPDSPLVNQSVNSIALPPQTLFVSILRDDEVFIPRGDSVLRVADRVIVLCLQSNFTTLKTLFNPNEI
jgi:trk system potassium uptake protein TrkA